MTKVYCKECKYLFDFSFLETARCCNKEFHKHSEKSWYSCDNNSQDSLCSENNKNNDCEYFEDKVLGEYMLGVAARFDEIEKFFEYIKIFILITYGTVVGIFIMSIIKMFR